MTAELAVVCWLWRGERDYRPAHVNALRRMCAKHLREPHRFVCVTDESPNDFDDGIEVLPTPKAALALAEMRTPEGSGMPSCYRRLWMFSDEARALGERVLLLDVDLVIIGDITHLLQRPESFVGWRPREPWGNAKRVAGGIYLMRTGSHPEVWNHFNADGIAMAREAGFRGSDQAWISYKLGSTCALWPEDAGIHALSELRREEPFPDTRIVQFSGHLKPWHSGLGWVRRHYRADPQMPKIFSDLIGAHRGARICVMGGAASLADHLRSVRADVYISCNAHGVEHAKADYLIAMDDTHNATREPMLRYLRARSSAPIISRHEWADYMLATWPGAPRTSVLTGMVAAWCAWAMGARVVILAGMDGYGGTSGAMRDAQLAAREIGVPVRVVGGGPLMKVWPEYDEREKLPRYRRHPALDGLAGRDGLTTIRVLKPALLRGVELAPGTEVQVMRHEVARLLKHRMVQEV